MELYLKRTACSHFRFPQDAKALVFTFIGMKAQEVTLTSRAVYDVVMQSDEQAMEEVIVVGYGVSRKRSQYRFAWSCERKRYSGDYLK